MAGKLEKLRNSIEHADTYSSKKGELQELITQAQSLFKKMAPLKEKLRSQRTMEGSRDLYFSFSKELDDLVLLLERVNRPSDLEPLLKRLANLFKQVFESLDLRWAEMTTRELFIKLYRISGRREIELYTVFKNVFAYAHDRGPQALNSMIESLDTIMQDSWGSIDDLEKTEKATEVMLRLGIDFLKTDISVTKRCAIAITNLAADMFEPKILAKQIVLAACANETDPNNLEAQELTQDLANWIENNDQYAWEAGIITYLQDAVEFAPLTKHNMELTLGYSRRTLSRQHCRGTFRLTSRAS